MAKVNIGKENYDLVLSLYAMEQIETEFGNLKTALEQFRAGAHNIKVVKAMFRILANAGLHAKGQPETVTGEEIANMGLKGLEQISLALNTALEESMRAETVGGGEADDDAADVYAEQLEAQEKNG